MRVVRQVLAGLNICISLRRRDVDQFGTVGCQQRNIIGWVNLGLKLIVVTTSPRSCGDSGEYMRSVRLGNNYG